MNIQIEKLGSALIKIDICVVTYKRPLQLKACLESLFVQTIHAEFPTRILVCDNDSEQSALPTIRNLQNENAVMEVQYCVEPTPNIALARNKILSQSSAELIAFIDDDEIAAPDWLEKAYLAMKIYDADAVFGRMIPVYDTDVPNIFSLGEAHALPNPLTGSTELFVPSTNNVLAKRKIYQIKNQGSFDASFGITGGSDTHFFSDPKLKGYRFIWCREAITYEKFDRRRANFKWYIKRHIRCGAVGARVALGYQHNESTRSLAIKTRLKQTKDTFYYMAKRYLKNRGGTWNDFFRLLRTLSYNAGFLGNIFCGITLKEYKKPITE